MPKSLAKFRLNGKELSLQLSNKERLIQFLKRLPFTHVRDRRALSEELHMSYEDGAFARVPAEMKHRVSHKSVFYGSPATIKALRKELGKDANN